MKKGQAFTVFKMLIGAAFAMMLLVVIYQAVNNIGCSTYCVDEIKSLTLQAVNMPGSCFEKQVCFDKGAVIEGSYLKKSLNLASVSVHSPLSSIHCSSNSCEFDFKANLPVKVKCDSPTSCDITIGKKCNS